MRVDQAILLFVSGSMLIKITCHSVALERSDQSRRHGGIFIWGLG